MGSVLVQSPAMVHHRTEEPSSKKLHPFFTKETSQPPLSPTTQPNTHGLGAAPTENSTIDTQEEHGPKKRRKLDSSTDSKNTHRPGNGNASTSNDAILTKTSVQKALEDTKVPRDDTAPLQQAADFPTPPLSESGAKNGEAIPGEAINKQDAKASPPSTPTGQSFPKAKKVLKLNPRTGTLGSPPKPKQAPSPSRLVHIKYGSDDKSRKDIGDKISQILAGDLKLPATPKRPRGRPPKVSNHGQSITSKATHPFFAGKPKPQPNGTPAQDPAPKKSPARRHSVFLSTPVSPRKPRIPFVTEKPLPPRFGSHGFGTKVPGAMHPQWPPLGMSHIRGDVDGCHCGTRVSGVEHARKSKGQIVSVIPQESILDRLVERLDLGQVRNSLPRNPDEFEPVPPELRVPTRHFESGRKLCQRIGPQLRACISTAAYESHPEHDELSIDQSTHPALAKLYTLLSSHLSAYDRSDCENLLWTTKYAPATADQVLQNGKEALLLKRWLETLRVQSVESGSIDSKAVKSKDKAEKAPRKKRKSKLDGFIVDSDEEADEMDEISDHEDELQLAGSGSSKKTVIRNGDISSKGSKDRRLTNTILLSGPHGCGKTAAVYAVAQELGFEVFEINSSSRRSGKDLLEKVGDMTRNHLVQQHRVEQHEDQDAVDDEVSKDLKSGKQGTMTSFFKPAAEKKAAKREQKQVDDSKTAKPRAQKQSLILLEEVDIIYEEDKQFWATLMTMISQSKRPFVMTCNDESLVPLQGLKLHGILRFAPPPTDMAADLCLLVAANEGHALQRSAVEAALKVRKYDLRATLADLNYWCQIGVGDRRGGFDWFYLRWPKGCDRDEHGDVVRVISGNTYRKGMGWINRDLQASNCGRLEMEEEVMEQCYDSWQLQIGDWYETLDVDACAEHSSQPGTDRTQRLCNLERYDDFCNSMSIADMCSSGGFGCFPREKLDPSLPKLPTKMTQDFITGRELLEAEPFITPHSTHLALSNLVTVLSRDELKASAPRTDSCSPVVLAPVDEGRAISMIESSFDSVVVSMDRYDLALAFDPIAASDKATSTTHLDPSVFDRTTTLITLDVAPWVRSIVSYDHRLMQERVKLSNLLSEGGQGPRKRMRTTRSAYSAMEGGERKTTRRDKYFEGLTTAWVMRTAGEGWLDAADAGDVSSVGDAASPSLSQMSMEA